MTRWIGALVGALLIISCTIPQAKAVTGTASADCDRAALVAQAAQELGEHRAWLRLVGPSEMEELSGDASNYGVAEPETVAFSTLMECRYVKSTVAHELTHVWQFRSGDEDYTPEDEIIADCGAVLTGWEDYSPYLTKRGYGCTPAELQQARQLRGWAK